MNSIQFQPKCIRIIDHDSYNINPLAADESIIYDTDC
jgi:hypothetical protein